MAQLQPGDPAARLVSGAFTAPVGAVGLDGQEPGAASVYPGPSLATVINERGPLDLPTVAALAAGLAEGLSAIHEAGVIHDDLTPAHVLLSPDGPRIVGFGISAAAGAASPAGTRPAPGTPAFMSPEQALARGTGQLSDIFSLGAVLTFAARGEGPFGTVDHSTLLYRIAEDDPDLDGVPGELRPLLRHCLARDPEERPTAAGFLAEVTAAFPAVSAPIDWRAVIAAPRAPAATSVLPPGLAPTPRPGPERGRQRRLLWLGSAVAVLAAAAIMIPLALAGSSSSGRGPASATTTPRASAGSSSPGRGPAFSWYRPGDCLKGSFSYVAGASWPPGTRVSCTASHDAEVYYANFRYWQAGSAYPGPGAVGVTAVEECTSALVAYDGAALSIQTIAYAPLGPDISSWNAGQRYIACVAYDLEGVHGSIKGTNQ